MEEQFNLVALASKKGYNRFHSDWFKNSELEPNSWYCELCLLQKWLRDEHKIMLEINYFDCEFWQWEITAKRIFIFGTNKTDDVDLTYEEALEIGLQEALKLIN